MKKFAEIVFNYKITCFGAITGLRGSGEREEEKIK
jgi:hypothetical protein